MNQVSELMDEADPTGKEAVCLCPARSCNAHLLAFCKVVSKYMDKGDPVNVRCLDFKKKQAQYESAVCCDSQEGKLHLGVH